MGINGANTLKFLGSSAFKRWRKMNQLIIPPGSNIETTIKNMKKVKREILKMNKIQSMKVIQSMKLIQVMTATVMISQQFALTSSHCWLMSENLFYLILILLLCSYFFSKYRGKYILVLNA